VFRSSDLLLLARSLRYLLLSPSAALRTSPSPRLGIVLAVGLAACDPSSRVAVRVSIPNADSIETPAPGVGVVALPYDRDSVVASLEARSRTKRPNTAALDSLFARFRQPFTAYTSAAYAARQLRDSIDVLRADLDSLPRTSPRYNALHARYARLSDSLAQTEKRAERARVALDRARTGFVSRSESLRAAVRQWEDSTYRGYDSIVEQLTRARRREQITDTTDFAGWADFTLPPGRWWLYARAWDTSDPNAEWYWNLPVDGDTLLLSSRTGRRRTKY
jgi:hypothetical protein